jgi:hypothetical protein
MMVMQIGTRQLLALALVLLASGSARAETKDDAWSSFRFLIGEWVGEGDGAPGKGAGGFTFALELDGKILVRRNRAEIPAAAGRPAATHEDLLVVYPAKGAKGALAMYWDNEGHVIRYTVMPSKDDGVLTFVSDSVAGEPRFRLTYKQEAKETVSIKFEFAPPGKPEDFKTYIEGKAHRKGNASSGK